MIAIHIVLIELLQAWYCFQLIQNHDSLFEAHQVNKAYQAIAITKGMLPMKSQKWKVSNRLERTDTRFLMHIAERPANSHSLIRCLQCSADKALFELKPITGKTHQLRLHMQSLGWPILHDSYYPQLQASKQPDDFSKPLQLLAQQLQFIDPVTQQSRSFSSGTELSLT